MQVCSNDAPCDCHQFVLHPYNLRIVLNMVLKFDKVIQILNLALYKLLDQRVGWFIGAQVGELLFRPMSKHMVAPCRSAECHL